MDDIETKRLLLRPLGPADLDDLFELYQDIDLMRYITGQTRSYEKTEARLNVYLNDHKQYGFGLCAAILKSSGEMIGRCGLEPVESKIGIEGDIGWMFKKKYWGQGLATEFGRAMIEYGFNHLPVRRIFARADVANTASIRVMQKLGMSFVKADQVEVVYELWHPDIKLHG